MTDTLPLFDVPDYARPQWRIESLQLVNWGGFQGHTHIPLGHGATLISGPSGSGKSTLLDAYLAVMMPDSTPFNGASNDATTGRARGSEQRSLLSYLRGKVDSSRDAEGGLHDQVLRGRESATWGAVAATFGNGHGRELTALRVFYVKASATRDSDIVKYLGVIDESFNLADMQAAVDSDLDKRVLRQLFPDLSVHDTYTAYAQHLFTRLGIGAGGGGGGARALRLLARIQAGYPVRRVDTLYKALVLEEPSTYAAADRAIDHFEDLEAAYTAMASEERKKQVLGRITELYDEWVAQRSTQALVGSIGHQDNGQTSVFGTWRARLERELLATAEQTNRAAAREAQEVAASALDTRTRLEDERDVVQRALTTGAGAALQRLKDRESDLHRRVNDRVAARQVFDVRTEPLGLDITTRDGFDRSRTDAKYIVDGFAVALQRINTDREIVDDERHSLRQTKTQLLAELESLKGRDGRVPARLHAVRVQMAEAAGMKATDLPFVAELLDIAQGEEKWRTAVEVSLGSVARVVLVDEERLEEFSRAIDGLRLRPRVNFEAVPAEPYRETQGTPGMVSGKVIHKNSPFSAWVQRRVRDARVDALCVDGARDLRGSGARVTSAGQTRQGQRGAHGLSDDAAIIGFSSAGRIQEIAAILVGIKPKLDAAEQKREELEGQANDLRDRKVAARVLLETSWAQIDVDAEKLALTSNLDEQSRLLDSNSDLNTLNLRFEDLKARLQTAFGDEASAKSSLETLDREHHHLQQRTAAADRQLDGPAPSPEQYEYLKTLLSQVGDPYDLAGLPEALRRLRVRLTEVAEASGLAARHARQSLEGIFQRFQENWLDPNLGTLVDSYDGYKEILDDIISTGLHARRGEWRRRLAQWSGEDLVPLSGAFETSVETIEERLRPVNDILSRLPFGARHDRLRIQLRRIDSDDIKAFKKELRRLSSGATAELDDDHVARRFAELQRFMGKLRRDDSHRGANTRDYFLDVRRHVEITAASVDADGLEVASYDSLGSKSGGETQELVAFIVGAALRFQLGDGDNPRPEFGPVVLDEGFVKADSQFAGRSVDAWKGLGFQLIVGAPVDKVTALEPRMDQVIVVTKDTSSGYSHISDITAGARR